MLRFGRYDYAAFLAFFVYASATVVLPLALVDIAAELGFPLEEGGMSAGGALHLIRTTAIVGAMLTCGFIAGRAGKRRTMGVSLLLLAIGLTSAALAPAYMILLPALLLAGAGEGVVEGLATPFVHDLHPEEPGRYINFTHAFWSVGIVTTVLVGGVMMATGVSWRLVVLAVAATTLLAAMFLLMPARPGREYPEHPEILHWRTVAGQARAIMRMPRFWLFFAAMFLAGGGEFCLTYWSASYLQLNLGTSVLAGGVGLACFAGGMVIGRSGWAMIIAQHHLRRLVVFSALAGTAVTLLLPLVANPLWFLLLLFAAGICTAPFWPSIQSHSTGRLPAADKTMLLIMLSCAGIPGCGFLTWVMGYIANHYGLRVAFNIVPACYILIAAIMAVDRYKVDGWTDG